LVERGLRAGAADWGWRLKPKRKGPARVAAGAARDSRYRVEKRSTFSIRLCPANEQLYRPIEPDDPDIRALADSIRKEGVKEPLVVTRDNYLLSGHRRLMAARLAGLVEVPVRVEPISYAKNRDRCVALLATYNRQRVKTNAELLNEEVVLADKDTAWAALREQRARESDLSGFSAGESINCAGPKIRRRISKAKIPFLDAAKRVIVDRRDYWPLSDRQIHYALLNDPPLRHAGKRASRYQNDRCSYKDLTDLLTRARLAGLISWAAIDDRAAANSRQGLAQRAGVRPPSSGQIVQRLLSQLPAIAGGPR
jgi:hypothetical protein